ncbi:hypothetical protein PSm6_55680 [Pseudomonas solani]|uniref:Uncharacterized protein n=1 Tax=Pseudomonas solani TaxID=2731552 RepID=A0AAU7YCL4_9PSED|nr:MULTISPECIES: hypothetical protein [Pseudomonas]MBB4820601.1 hypothetical protein [Pseudomonas alcaligenes]MDN4148543.1 hypothetical protein [Pseudomonas tohonis]MDU9414410.1 hypothetical protein [Pseudomonas sp. zfem005]BCD89161.1 hypothetical protein PSm6_55680 [Pseudomonas solani]
MGNSSRIGVALALLLGATTVWAEEPAEDASTLKESAKAAVSTAISAGKNLLGGASQGITEGRESAQGADGAIVISQLDQLEGKVEVKLLKVDTTDENFGALLGFKNLTEKPVRLINLLHNGALLAIDQDDYSSNLVPMENPEEVTVPPKTGVRQRFVFQGPVEGPKAVRLWGREYSVK